MIITVSVWRPHEFEEQVTHVENTNITVTKIFYFGQYEFSTHGLGGDTNYDFLVKVLNYANSLEIPIYIVTSNISNLLNGAREATITLPKNIKLIEWGTFYFANLWFHVSLEASLGIQPSDAARYKTEFFNFLTNPNTKNYHYISLNNHPHIHKCIMMDTLAKHDLIKYGAVSWLQNGNGVRTSEELQHELEFQFKYWIPEILKLDVNAVDSVDNTTESFYRGKVPSEYNYSFMHLITESYTEEIFISEKTPIALLLMKPFLAIAAKGFHQNLERLGFKLYDEIFDYSFDLEDTVEARCEGIAENIKKISHLSTEELTNLYSELFSKLKYNRSVALGFATTIPSEVRDLWNMKDQFINIDFDGEFNSLINNLYN